MTASPLLVVYDVRTDGRRARLRAALDPWADRVQQSAWVHEPQRDLDADRLRLRLARILTQADRLRVYEPCPRCLALARWCPPRPAPLAWRRPQVR